MKGAGMGRIVKWNRKARVAYVQCRTGKGNLQAWRHKIRKTDSPECRRCGKYAETGKHIALVCTHGEHIGRKWGTWEGMDDRARCVKKEKDDKGWYTVDLVETFFSEFDLVCFCYACFARGRAGRGVVEEESIYTRGRAGKGVVEEAYVLGHSQAVYPLCRSRAINIITQFSK